jgi:hypothetical protein
LLSDLEPLDDESEDEDDDESEEEDDESDEDEDEELPSLSLYLEGSFFPPLRLSVL